MNLPSRIDLANQTEGMKYKYDISFDFTTVHKGSRFVGRSSRTEVESPRPLSDVDRENDDLKSCLAQSILSFRPTYKIFMLSITEIKPL